MKISKYLALGLLVISLTPVWGQSNPKKNSLDQVVDQSIRNAQTVEVFQKKTALTKFNLDFPGGTPAQLVKAIEKAMGKPLNVIIPDEDADIQLPPLKMNDVMVPQLFVALEEASRKTVATSIPGYGFQNFNTSYGFKSADNLTDDSVWYFHADKLPLPMTSTQKICQFYSLDRYLNRGFTVDDITTAIQTGWKMAGITSPPELNYHKETKLLIAFGEPDKLKTIQNVLDTLPQDSEYPVLRGQVIQLQQEVDRLTKKISAQNASSNSVPEEKSEK
jgi:hypothetical protein